MLWRFSRRDCLKMSPVIPIFKQYHISPVSAIAIFSSLIPLWQFGSAWNAFDFQHSCYHVLQTWFFFPNNKSTLKHWLELGANDGVRICSCWWGLFVLQVFDHKVFHHSDFTELVLGDQLSLCSRTQERVQFLSVPIVFVTQVSVYLVTQNDLLRPLSFSPLQMQLI